MPGTPYLEEPPPGLLTWPKLLALTLPTFGALTAVAWWQNLLIEWAILVTISLTVSFLIRR